MFFSMEKLVTRSNRILADERYHAGDRRFLLSALPYRLVRYVIAIIFLGSGLTKLFDPGGFAVIIEAYGLIPETWIIPVAYVLPLLEMMAGVGLLLDLTGSLSLLAGLLLLFMAILGFGIVLGLDVDCGCFGPEDPEANAFHGLRTALYRDLFILAGIAYLFWRRYRLAPKPVRWINLI
jgi:uncharacterized membrane protein YphA (DoxX/SURF4 family)